MYLEKMKITHFRKFNENNNEVIFYNHPVDGELDISKVSTLIVGQNNAGKSTVFKAFGMLYFSETFTSSDFNYDYLLEYFDDVLSGRLDEEKNLICPNMEFEFIIIIPKDDEDSLSSVADILDIGSIVEDENSKAVLGVSIKLKNETVFRSFLNKQVEYYNSELSKGVKKDIVIKREIIDAMLEKIDEIGLVQIYSNIQNDRINIKFSDLFNFKLIDALSVNDECVLSKQFKSILKYHYSQGDLVESEEMNESIKRINDEVAELLSKRPSAFINDVIANIISKSVKMALYSSMSFETILDNCVKYFYDEDNFSIPEDHYGLGYTKLVSIVANLLDYIERRPEKNLDRKISIIAIEEPETFMHPQLQRCFINNINEVLNKILNTRDKKIKCQLVISTHSPHIVSDKIETANSLNNINYFGVVNNKTNIVLLNDELFTTPNNNPFSNIKKHMSFSFAEALFSDAIILVEGFAEEKMIPYFLSNYKQLKNKYISIININGAHAYIYNKLLEALKIPAVIITDIDFKINDGDFSQIEDYDKQHTTNSTIKDAIGTDDLSKLTSCEIKHNSIENIRIFIQEKENDYCGTSFEEALILANYDNDILINSLKTTSRNNFYRISQFRNLWEKEPEIVKNNINNKSKELYKMLVDKKGDFTTNLLQSIIESDKHINTPSYILKAFEYLSSEVK